MTSRGKYNLPNSLHIVKSPVKVLLVSNLSVGIGTMRELWLDTGTLVSVQVQYIKSPMDVMIKIVNEDGKYDISENDIWRCSKSALIHVDENLYPFIQSVPSPHEKVHLLSDKSLCEQLANLKLGDRVYVVLEDDTLNNAVILYKGTIPKKGPGIYFGVELLDDYCKGDTDGEYKGTKYFHCPKNAGLFVTISLMRPVEKKMSKSTYTTHTQNQNQLYFQPENKRDYERSSYKLNNHEIYSTGRDRRTDSEKSLGTIDKKGKYTQYLGNDSSTQVRESDLRRDYDNEDLIFWDESKEDYFNKANRNLLSPDGGSNGSEGNGYYDMSSFSDQDIAVGSAVEVIYNDVPHYGVVQWIGILKDDPKRKIKAGIEMDKEDPDFTDGSYNFIQYFHCAPNRALFVDINHCQLDSRISESVPPVSRKSEDFGAVESPVVTGSVSPISREGDITPICGKYKGIQGHHNSCYLDATLFSMFTFTSVFDSLLYRPAGPTDIPHYDQVQRVLREEIVNPLRKNNFVRADRVMKLRRLMEQLSSVSGLTTEEKDPEEFLTSLVTQILKAEPYLKLSSGQEAYHYQLFVEKNEKLVLPTVQQLFEQSFYSSDIKLKEVPACLIIQMPRFGKSFKMYPRILPSQLLDVTDVIEDSPRQCSVCGNLAVFECRNCFDEGHSSEVGLQNTAFCGTCLKKVHAHCKRTHHSYRRISRPDDYIIHGVIPRLYMELFAVVCIETSHYVTFVKCGDGSDAPWCFFDSMADRKGEQNGYNIPEVVPCPDLPQWLSEKGAQALQQIKDDRQLPEHAKRLLCDAYMCMYQSTEVMMYR
ncbi:ubiquitin carboxyl-terminal hydrolase CYLD isoform X2 [Cimex lectularius]|uniref:ubiquitinyl hydrolase 1 n=1 Tax=Cimex lectularius TaxID=79782 RepID=A0A8I6S5S4_CIMLE|nr:ubiquitin carboxyl-terminal hydrolase CYLD isoform X2 [Cimex lectularius]